MFSGCNHPLFSYRHDISSHASAAHFQLTCSNGSCAESPAEISPIYSLWATFIGLYIANYVVERSTG